jgi:hypothetical protein
MLTFSHDNQGLTVSLIILIVFLIICNLAKLLTTKSTFQNTHGTYSEINYFPNKCGQTATTYCPGQHPKIPCDMVKSCPDKDTLPPEISEYVDSYVYLIALMNGIKNTVPGTKWWEPQTVKGF